MDKRKSDEFNNHHNNYNYIKKAFILLINSQDEQSRLTLTKYIAHESYNRNLISTRLPPQNSKQRSFRKDDSKYNPNSIYKNKISSVHSIFLYITF